MDGQTPTAGPRTGYSPVMGMLLGRWWRGGATTSLVLAIAAWLTPAQGAHPWSQASSSQAPEGAWAARVELGLSNALDLSTARTSPVGKGPVGPTLSLAPTKIATRDPIQGATGLRFDGPHVVTRLESSETLIPLERVARVSAATGEGRDLRLEVGAEFIVEPAEGDFWCYLRVLDVAVDRVHLEVASAPGTVPMFRRSPAGLRVSSTGGAFRLRWDRLSAETDATYRVRRRVTAAAPAVEARDGVKKAISPPSAAEEWETLAIVRGSEFTEKNAPWGEVFHYEVARCDGDGRLLPGSLGRVIQTARVDTPGEWALGVDTGGRVDLVSGRIVGPDDLAHIEVHSGATGSFALKPVEGVRFALEQKASLFQDGSWWLIPGTDRRLVPGRTAMVAPGGELQFRLPDGTLGRLSIDAERGSICRLRRQLAMNGDRLLPRPPGSPPEVQRGGAGEVKLLFSDLDRRTGVDPERVILVVEKEVRFGQGDWSILGESAAGSRALVLSGLFDGPSSIVRLRFRHRLRSGALSHPSLPLDLLPAGFDGERRGELLDAALVGVDAEDFQRRLESRGVLLALGEDARGPLMELARGPRSPRALAAQSILEAIESADGSGAGLVRRFRRRALELAVEAPRLSELSDAERTKLFTELEPELRFDEPGERLHGLLCFIDRAERGVLRGEAAPGDLRDDCEVARVWARAIAQTEPDPGARKVAGFVATLGVVPSMASFEAERPAFLPDGAAPSGDNPLPGASWTDLPGAAEELAWQLESRPELADLDFGPPLAQLLHWLRSADGAAGRWGGESDARLFDYDARTAELCLRLVERARAAEDPRPLLEAAAGLVGGEAIELAARREVSDRRLASPSRGASLRRSVLIETPSLELLEVALGEAADRAARREPGEPVEGVDILLPPGIYEDASGAPVRTLEILASGVRLMPSAPGARVEVRAALRIRGARDVVLQDLTLISAASTALNVLEGAHLVLLRSKVASAGTVVFLQHSDLEMTESRLEGASAAGKPPQWAIRELGRCRLSVRSSYLNAGSIYLSDESENSMDRSVLDAGARTLIQAPRAGHLVARECLLRGTNLGLYHVDRGVLAGVAIDVPRDPLGRQPGGLRVGPRFFHLVGEGQVVPPTMRLEVEPLQPR